MFRFGATPFPCPKDHARKARIIRSGGDKEQDHGGEGERKAEPGGFCYSLLGKQVPFLQRLYYCLPFWIAFLLPLVCKWIENTTSRVSSKKKKKEKKRFRSVGQFFFWQTEERVRMSHFHVAS